MFDDNYDDYGNYGGGGYGGRGMMGRRGGMGMEEDVPCQIPSSRPLTFHSQQLLARPKSFPCDIELM